MTRAYLGDCMEAMSQMKDNEFQLAIVDPPYGIDIVEKSNRLGRNGTKWRSGGRFKYYKYSEWDKQTPTNEYFLELKRISRNRIVWGWNYLSEFLPPTKCFIIWDKIGRDDRADGECAWASFDKPSKIYRYSRADAYINDCDIKIHPTQKPVALYKWLLKNYAKEGDTILDTHLGSASSRIACHDMGFEFTGYEIDKDYFDASEKRFQNHIRQGNLFQPKDMYQ